MKLNETIIRLDRKQPEGGIAFEKYKNNVVTPLRIREGRGLRAHHERVLAKVSKAYGVPPEFIVALWGIETSYGKVTGGFETIPALVTLAYDGRRSAFFRDQLLKALHIVDQGHVRLHEMRGSWAGAMGQCQFMPSSFEKYAQDFDRDGKKDIWGTRADVFASTAKYLSTMGWNAAEPWGKRVALPAGFSCDLLGPKVQKTAEAWRQEGLHIPRGVFAAEEPLSIVQSGGEGYKAYVVGQNYRILLDWNNSTYFATAVGLLADQIRG